MISHVDLQRLTQVVQGMIRFEEALADFYQRCGEADREREAFWQGIAGVERQHAKNLERLLAVLTQKPERFEAGRPFNLVALQTTLAGIEENSRRVAQGEVSPERLLILARDIEQSVLESHYAEIVRTSDIEFQTLMRGILEDTRSHKGMIQAAIDGTRTAP